MPVSKPRPVLLGPASPRAVPKAPQPRLNPLTGLKPRNVPVVVVKIDNARTARPFQRGINHAAVVYQELVESGLTRFAAVYDGSWSGEVGPIRSARETDLELLAQYGRVTLAFSGANAGVMRTIGRAHHKGQVIDASYEHVKAPYREGKRRPDAYNIFSTPNKLRKARPGVAAKDVGFHFARLPKGIWGKGASVARVSFSPYSTVTVRYDRRIGRYRVFQDGQPMKGVAPANVIVQSVPIRGSKYVDILGARTPYTKTTGRGRAVLLRDGRMMRATWRRLTSWTGTRFLDGRGQDLPMKPGPTWVLLQPQGMPTVFR